METWNALLDGAFAAPIGPIPLVKGGRVKPTDGPSIHDS
jgi:hypothetical protein